MSAPEEERFQLEAPFLLDRAKLNYSKEEGKVDKGCSGTVFRGSYDGRSVAIKVFPTESNTGEVPHNNELDIVSREEFEREIYALSKLKHQNIVQFIGAILEERIVVEEFIEGCSLKDYIKRSKLDLPTAIRFALKICSAMHFMHEHQILHRDLKPDNVMVTVKGEIKVIDFGFSRKIASRMSPNKGSEFYRAPEVNSRGTNSVVYDAKADAFSFSYIFYELLTGQEAVISKGKSRPSIGGWWKQKIPGSILDLLSHCWDKNPSNRPTFKEIIESLNNISVANPDLNDASTK